MWILQWYIFIWTLQFILHMGTCPLVSDFSAQQRQEAWNTQEARNTLPQKRDINHMYCVREEVMGSRFYLADVY